MPSETAAFTVGIRCAASHAWTDDPPVADDPDAYQSVKCIGLAVELSQRAHRPCA
jgi:hypothetical protein